MSTQPTEATATETQESQQQGKPNEASPTEAKPTETVDYWKQKSRENEKRAKENSDAAKRLKDIEDAQKSESTKASERITELEGLIPQTFNSAFREAAVAFGGISREDADLFLTGTDQETLAKQAERLGARVAEQKKTNNRVAKEGTSTATGSTPGDDEREFARGFFGGGS